MPLTPDERDRIRETETLKAEIRKELAVEPTASSISKFFSHPAILLIFGFFLTGIVGSALTSYWSDRQWSNQQSYLERQRLLEKKFDLIDQTIKAIAETNTAAEDVLATSFWAGWQKEEITERRARWETSSHEWRVASKSLYPKLEIYFTNPDIPSTFNNIMVNRNQLGNKITNLLAGKIPPGTPANTLADEALKQTIENIELLKKLGSLMAKEVDHGRSEHQPSIRIWPFQSGMVVKVSARPQSWKL
jgi:hypothetical protein